MNNRQKPIFVGVLLVTVLLFMYRDGSKGPPRVSSPHPVYDEVVKRISDATGDIFVGQKIRSFNDVASQKNGGNFEDSVVFEEASVNSAVISNCDKWGVMTTISSPPTEAIRRFLYMTDWCVVVVGDFDRPKDFSLDTTLGSNVVFLSSDDQQKLGVDFIDSLPWNSFARKNVGYVYAIANGAQVIWDFDDDNALKFWLPGGSPDPTLEIDFFTNLTSTDGFDTVEPSFCQNDSSSGLFNPYPLLGAPEKFCWPRGFPLDQIRNPATWNATFGETTSKPLQSFGILQSLADYQPDVDAIYRMTKPTPFFFKRLSSKRSTQRLPIVKIPDDRLVPYNAQATLHTYDAFWSLFLPTTVAGRVSDIWRSFVAQSIFKNLNLAVGFLPRPIVVQERNPHSYEADFNAELPLYQKSNALTDFIYNEYLSKPETIDNLPEKLEQVWIEFYERGYVEIDDVFLVQRWIKTLSDIGYQFPTSEKKFSKTAEKIPQTQLSKRISSVGKTLKELSRRHIDSEFKDSNYAASTCLFNHADDGVPVTFGNSDIHIGPRTDLPSLLSHLKQNVVLMGLFAQRNISNYPEVLQSKYVRVYKPISSTLSRYESHTYRLTPLGIERNTEFYSNDKVVGDIDAFVCTFPSSMCQLWMDLNKTIIYLPAHRYNLGRCIEKEWRRLNSDIYQLAANRDRGHTIASMSRYDAEYMRYYTGLRATILTSFSGYYALGHNYKPTKDEILIFCLREGAKDFQTKVIRALKPDFKAVRVYDKYEFYTFDDLVSHRAVVMLPYSVMTYRLTELYVLNIPLFVPSTKFFLNHYDPETKRHGIGHDRTSTSSPYCSLTPRLESQMRPDPSMNFSSHPYSPNLEYEENVEAEMYWLQFADYYDWPHIQHFDSYAHLKSLLLSSDFEAIHEKMKEENEIRGLVLNKRWCDVIERIKEAKSTMP